MRYCLIRPDRIAYIFVVPSGTDGLSLCIECTFDVASLLLRLEVPCYLLGQSSDFRKSGIADIAFEQVRGKGQSRQREKRCAAKERHLHV
jgi:hypothetical protein